MASRKSNLHKTNVGEPMWTTQRCLICDQERLGQDEDLSATSHTETTRCASPNPRRPVTRVSVTPHHHQGRAGCEHTPTGPTGAHNGLAPAFLKSDLFLITYFTAP